MRKFFPFVCVWGLAAASLAAQPAKSPQKPGKWQVRMEMEIPGVPAKMPAITNEMCLTEADLADPQKAVPNDSKSDCKVSDYTVKDNKVTWSMECPKQKMKGTGEMTFTADAYTGIMNVSSDQQKMSMKYTGKYLGACTK